MFFYPVFVIMTLRRGHVMFLKSCHKGTVCFSYVLLVAGGTFYFVDNVFPKTNTFLSLPDAVVFWSEHCCSFELPMEWLGGHKCGY